MGGKDEGKMGREDVWTKVDEDVRVLGHREQDLFWEYYLQCGR
jgi:hypothetical protein